MTLKISPCRIWTTDPPTSSGLPYVFPDRGQASAGKMQEHAVATAGHGLSNSGQTGSGDDGGGEGDGANGGGGSGDSGGGGGGGGLSAGASAEGSSGLVSAGGDISNDRRNGGGSDVRLHIDVSASSEGTASPAKPGASAQSMSGLPSPHHHTRPHASRWCIYIREVEGEQAEVIFSHRSNKRRIVSLSHLIGRWNEVRFMVSMVVKMPGHQCSQAVFVSWVGAISSMASCNSAMGPLKGLWRYMAASPYKLTATPAQARALETLEMNHRDTAKALAEWQQEMDSVEPETVSWEQE